MLRSTYGGDDAGCNLSGPYGRSVRTLQRCGGGGILSPTSAAQATAALHARGIPNGLGTAAPDPERSARVYFMKYLPNIVAGVVQLGTTIFTMDVVRRDLFLACGVASVAAIAAYFVVGFVQRRISRRGGM